MTSEATAAPGVKAKKSVALSGVTAGNTALCTVGRTGNDLHYRGYDILDIADVCEFEEIAHLLVHGTLPTASELAAYKAPRIWVFVEEFPMTPSGKVQKFVLRQQCPTPSANGR